MWSVGVDSPTYYHTETKMKVKYEVKPVMLGHSFSNQYIGYASHLDRLVFSVSNPRTKRGTWARGGGFLVHHQSHDFSVVQLPKYTYLGNQHGGAAAPTGYRTTYPTVAPTSPSYASERDYTLPWGTKGYARARPGNPAANVGQFIAELRQLPSVPILGGTNDSIFRGALRGLPGRALQRLASFRRLGSEYLNIQFGWVPFVKDLQDMHKLTHDLDRRLNQLRRDNGRSLHRERELVNSTTVTASESVVNGPFAYLSPTPIIIGGGRTSRSVITRTHEKIWFEGKFRYYVPDIGTLAWSRRATRALYGGNLTPSLAWEILPWSWLVDWFSNVGDVMSNLSSNAVDDTVVSQYAYVMRTHESETVTCVQTSWGGRSGSPATYPAGSGVATLTDKRVTKSRVPATPYGFGVTNGGLNAFRVSILAALGISRRSFL